MPSTFQQMVDNVLQEEKASSHVEVYIDNILVHTKNEADNWYWTGWVLLALSSNKLFVRLKKCSFKQMEVEFFRMVICKGKVGVSSGKVKAILEEKPPMIKKGVWHFLGITNYHRQFIKDYARIVKPLHELTKDVPFIWTEAQAQAFENLKNTLVMGPVLALPRDKGKFQLETDASDVATGTVLSQQQEDSTYWPLGFISKWFNEVEQQYTMYDKELLGIMQALEDWQNLHISMDKLFEILTDHCNLTYFRDPQKLTGHQVN
jgi:hypothetical protein